MNVQEVQMNTTEFESVIEKCSFLGITREFFDVCEGNWPQTRLLSAFVYWFRPGANGHGRAVKFRDGLYWVYKTAEEWQTETGLSEWEFRKALDALEASGLVERRSMMASNANGQCVKQLHLSLDKNLLVKMIDAVQATHDYPHAAVVPDQSLSPVGTSHPTHSLTLVKPFARSILSESHNVSTEGSPGKAKASTKTSGGEPAKPQIAEEKTKTVEVEKIEKEEQEEQEEKEEKIGEVSAGPVLPGKKVLGIDALWAAIPGSKPLTGKQRGQLHGLVRKAGWTAYYAVDYAISHWSEFAHHAMNKAGGSYPLYPNIDYMTKHFSAAFELWYRSLYSSKQDEVRAFLIKRGDWWHTVPGLQEKVGVVVNPMGDLYLPPPKAPLSYETAWSIYTKTETPEQAANRHKLYLDYSYAEQAAENAPHDEAKQAKYLAAKKVYVESEKEALKKLGWVEEVQEAA